MNRVDPNTRTRALFVALGLMTFDVVWLYFGYASKFLATVDHAWVTIYTLGLGGLTAAVIFLITSAWTALTRRMPRVENVRFATFLGTGFVLITGLLVTVACSGVSVLSRVALGAVVLVLGTITLVALRFLSSRLERSTYVGLVVVAFMIAGFFVSQHWGFFVFREFGLTDKGLKRTIFVAGAPPAFSIALPTIAYVYQRVKTWLIVPLLVVPAIAVFLADGTMYVDDYFSLHLMLLAFQVVCLWFAADFLTERLMNGNGVGRAAFILSGVLAVCFVATLFTFRSTNYGYVAAIHTVHQRRALEFSSAVPHAVYKPVLWKNAFVRRWNRMRHDRETVEPFDGELPVTFKKVEPRERVARNAVLFFLDMKRPEQIGLYGAGGETPGIDRCFENASVFTSAFSAANSTEISFAVIYSGTYGATRAQDRVTRASLPEWYDVRKERGGPANIPDAFDHVGFQTHVLVDPWYHSRFFKRSGREQEFSPVFGDYHHVNVSKVIGSPDSPAGIQALIDQGVLNDLQEPFLLSVHILSHAPEELPAVDQTVDQICNILRNAGHLENSLLMLTSDHGYQEREHGRTHYGRTLFDSEVRVPLLLEVPGHVGRKVTQPVSSVDHLPSLLDAFEIDLETRFEGRSYLPLAFGETNTSRDIFVETRSEYASTGIISDDYKLIRWSSTGVYSMFDREKDPLEIRNLITDESVAPEFERLKKSLLEFREQRDESDWRP